MATVDIRLPNINATTDAGQLAQIRSYLYQFSEQMKWALNNIEQGGDSSSVQTVDASGNPVPSSSESSDDSISNFGQIKSLIIKSADIVNAFYQQIETRLDGAYVAQSDFGEYQEATSQLISATSTNITQNYTAAIAIAVGGIQTQINNTNAYIKTGQVDTDSGGNPIYGLEIGQTLSDSQGTPTFKKFARFTADRLSFYDNGSAEVAYISDYKLYITNAQITDTLIIGGYKLEFSSGNGLYFKWIGR